MIKIIDQILRPNFKKHPSGEFLMSRVGAPRGLGISLSVTSYSMRSLNYQPTMHYNALLQGKTLQITIDLHGLN